MRSEYNRKRVAQYVSNIEGKGKKNKSDDKSSLEEKKEEQ